MGSPPSVVMCVRALVGVLLSRAFDATLGPREFPTRRYASCFENKDGCKALQRETRVLCWGVAVLCALQLSLRVDCDKGKRLTAY